MFWYSLGIHLLNNWRNIPLLYYPTDLGDTIYKINKDKFEVELF